MVCIRIGTQLDIKEILLDEKFLVAEASCRACLRALVVACAERQYNNGVRERRCAL